MVERIVLIRCTRLLESEGLLPAMRSKPTVLLSNFKRTFPYVPTHLHYIMVRIMR